jgi:hypothetical protein
MSGFDTVHNYHEDAVFRAVIESAVHHPWASGQPDLLADVACVALNRLPPRYVRHDLDTQFYMGDDARIRLEAAIKTAVDYAFGFVKSKTVPPSPKAAKDA